MDKTQLTALLQFIKTVPDNNFLAAACLAALASKSDTGKTALLLNELYSSSEKKAESVSEPKQSASTLLYFSKKEIASMSKTFKKEFIANGLAAHVRLQNLRNPYASVRLQIILQERDQHSGRSDYRII